MCDRAEYVDMLYALNKTQEDMLKERARVEDLRRQLIIALQDGIAAQKDMLEERARNLASETEIARLKEVAAAAKYQSSCQERRSQILADKLAAAENTIRGLHKFI